MILYSAKDILDDLFEERAFDVFDPITLRDLQNTMIILILYKSGAFLSIALCSISSGQIGRIDPVLNKWSYAEFDQFGASFGEGNDTPKLRHPNQKINGWKR